MAEVYIQSYFALETDLAGEMQAWPEFQSGKDYDVELFSSADGERVAVEWVDPQEDRGPYVRVVGSLGGPLFDRVLGRTIHALAAHSDHLVIDRRS